MHLSTEKGIYQREARGGLWKSIWAFIASLRGRSMNERIQALQHPLRWLNEAAHFVKTCHTVLVLEDGENSRGEVEPNFSLPQVSCLFSESRWTQYRRYWSLASKVTVWGLCGAMWDGFSIPWKEALVFLFNRCAPEKRPSFLKDGSEN